MPAARAKTASPSSEGTTKMKGQASLDSSMEPNDSTAVNKSKNTPKKRGAAKANDDAGPAKKKKASHEAAEKAEEGDEAAEPVTPKKGRGRGKGKDKEDNAAAADEPLTPPSTTKKGDARKRAAPKKKIEKATPLPASIEKASASDKLIWDMKTAGKSWTEIRTAWTALTGDAPGNSTLNNRYNRLRSAFLVLKEEDKLRFLEAQDEFDAEVRAAANKMDAEKWGKIIKAMEDKGTTEKYTTIFLQKKSEEFKANPELVAAIKASAHGSNADDSDNAANTSDNDLKEGALIGAKDDVSEEGDENENGEGIEEEGNEEGEAVKEASNEDDESVKGERDNEDEAANEEGDNEDDAANEEEEKEDTTMEDTTVATGENSG